MILSCENKIEQLNTILNKNTSTEEGFDITLYISLGGKPKTILKAPIMIRTVEPNGERKTVFPKNVNMDFYLDSTFINSHLKAKYGSIIESTNQLFFKDSVVVYNISGDTLWSDELYWDPALQKLYSEKPVVIKQHNPLSKLYALGFTSNKDLSDIVLKTITNSYFQINENLNFNN